MFMGYLNLLFNSSVHISLHYYDYDRYDRDDKYAIPHQNVQFDRNGKEIQLCGSEDATEKLQSKHGLNNRDFRKRWPAVRRS